MNVAMVESLRQWSELEVTLLSKYPRDDREACESQGWRMVPFSTGRQLLCLPVALLYAMLRALGLPRRWLARGALASYVESDVLVDLSGISFSDHRSLVGLAINCLWLLPAIATGIPWGKASQAMGPFDHWPVRMAARYCLSRAAVLVARGASSASYLRGLLPERTVHDLPDVAFLLPPAGVDEVRQLLGAIDIEPDEHYTIVGPSYVVASKMRAQRAVVTYIELMAKAVDALVEQSNLKVILLPHERAHTGRQLDDIHVCREVYEACQHRDRVQVFAASASAMHLKGVIARADVAMGSRFHFIVAAVSTGVPAMALGWSHKYLEVMQTLGHGHWAIQCDDVREHHFVSKIRELWDRRGVLRREILGRMPEIQRLAGENARLMVQARSVRCPDQPL